ncbi:MAG TPA: IclR family transcriptional regulator, partial [Ochrobactrum intermedium]
YAVCDEEAVIGGSGVAAPVFDASGEVVAALNMATISPRFTACRQRMIDAVIKHAAELSARLGYKPSTTDKQ